MRLLLLRHAKSDWSGKGSDHERPLAARGRRAAEQMGVYLQMEGYEPVRVLCSTATRARETWQLVSAAFANKPEVRYERGLYLAEWPQLLEKIRGAGAAVSPLMLIGHNPGMEQLAIALALRSSSAAERGRLERLAEKFPAGALAVLDFDDLLWRNVKPGSGRLAAYVRPKDLRDGSLDDED